MFRSDADKGKAIEAAVAVIEKQFGKGAIMCLGQSSKLDHIDVVSSGSLSLDIALGVGGIPRGRVIEIFGPESSGKTTMMLHIVVEVQRAGGTAAFVDAEHALDIAYARSMGVNVDELLVAQPDTGEQALEIVDMLVRSGAIDLVIIDSVAALTPKSELEGEMGDHHVGVQARLMSQALRKITSSVARSNCIVAFINQMRMKIGVMFGSPETTTGGNALKFYASVRLDIRRVASIKQGEEVVGNRTRVKVVKNKVAAPFKQAEFDIMFGKGVSRSGDILDLAVTKDVVKKSGAWFSYGEERLGQGRESVKEYLESQPDLMRKIELETRKAFGIKEEPVKLGKSAEGKAGGKDESAASGKIGAGSGQAALGKGLPATAAATAALGGKSSSATVATGAAGGGKAGPTAANPTAAAAAAKGRRNGSAASADDLGDFS